MKKGDIKLCEKCNSEMVPVESSFEIGMTCPNCGWGWITTNTDCFSENDIKHSILLEKNNFVSKDSIKIIAKLSNLNYIQAKSLLENGGSLVFYGNTDKLCSEFNSHGIKYTISECK